MMLVRINVLHLNIVGAVEIGTTFIRNEIVRINVNVSGNRINNHHHHHHLKPIT